MKCRGMMAMSSADSIDQMDSVWPIVAEGEGEKGEGEKGEGEKGEGEKGEGEKDSCTAETGVRCYIGVTECASSKSHCNKLHQCRCKDGECFNGKLKECVPLHVTPAPTVRRRRERRRRTYVCGDNKAIPGSDKR